ncbi:hypothetical protein KUBF_37790 [Bacteroides finegoldii]|uniref:Uncharacterized protein n=1 Tax=Bacteroides xylanisolvens TaxID=371601 RepID=A0A1Y4VP86_9BACE|nr:hypothetical protein B5E52_06350 [Bacteroides xylanisolvens]GLL56116.1 hypothetical protein KUBF_37790 [Bacteroides finegoldii]
MDFIYFDVVFIDITLLFNISSVDMYISTLINDNSIPLKSGEVKILVLQEKNTFENEETMIFTEYL